MRRSDLSEAHRFVDTLIKQGDMAIESYTVKFKSYPGELGSSLRIEPSHTQWTGWKHSDSAGSTSQLPVFSHREQ
jgi:hypothetical protein